MKLTIDKGVATKIDLTANTTDIVVQNAVNLDVSVTPQSKTLLQLERGGFGNVPWANITHQPHVEAYDLSSTYPVNSVPAVLKPASTIANSSGITYNPATGVFTFIDEGSYQLALNVNAIASASGQTIYIYAQNWNGTTWVNNANSGKVYQLPNRQEVQIVYANAVYRVAGQQVRYLIYSNDGKVQLQTFTLPGLTPPVYVPAIRIQYT